MTIARVLAGEQRWHVEHGNALDAFRSMPDASVDAVVTDPPYGLGNREPSLDEIVAYLRGDSLNTGGDFMGKDWEIPPVAIWRECFRVLKPGAHLLAFAGTRTMDLVSLGIRAAGFANRDTISCDGLLRWYYGSGFPKSLNVAKAIDSHLGVDPTVIGSRTLTGSAALSTKEKGGTFAAGTTSEGRTKEVDVTRATSPEAQAHEGEGTAIKPAWEPILVFRKPLVGTVAENVLAHGTGALNIDATRIGYVDEEDKAAAAAAAAQRLIHDQNANRSAFGEFTNGSKSLQPYLDKQSLGRWPANVVLCHLDGCVPVGSAAVKAHPAWNDNRPPSSFTGAATSPIRHGEGDVETIERWACVAGCPIADLDEQSGSLKSDSWDGNRAQPKTASAYGRFSLAAESPRMGDSGGASRFFYCAKADAGEREAGLDHLPKRSAAELVDREEGTAALNCPRTGAGRSSSGRANGHPTVKPIDLMRWLVRLVTPRGGVLVDPFVGSGTTAIAGVLEGFRVVAAEQMPRPDHDDDIDAVTIARARIAHWAANGKPKKAAPVADPRQATLFDLAGGTK